MTMRSITNDAIEATELEYKKAIRRVQHSLSALNARLFAAGLEALDKIPDQAFEDAEYAAQLAAASRAND